MTLINRLIALHLLGQAKKPIALDDGTGIAFVNAALATPHVHMAPTPTTYSITERGREVLAAVQRVSARDLRLIAELT